MIAVCLINYEQSAQHDIRKLLMSPNNDFMLVYESTSDEETIHILEQHPIDIVLACLEPSNLSILRYIREQGFSCHIIILTKKRDFDFLRETLRIGVDDFLVTPLNIDELLAALQRIESKMVRARSLLSQTVSHSPAEEKIQQIMELHYRPYPSKGNRLIYLAVQYIEQHLQEPDLSLHKVASAIFSNKSYLSHVFKQELNISMMDYITTKRIAKSIPLLKTTDMKVYEIAEQIGFRNPHYFGICFKKHIGITIKEFKANYFWFHEKYPPTQS